MPFPTDPNYIRFTAADGVIQFNVISDTEVEIVYELVANLSGLVTADFVDYLLVYAPYLTLQNIRESLKNPKYHNRSHDFSFVQF